MVCRESGFHPRRDLQSDFFGTTTTNLMRTGVAPVQAFSLLFLLHCALDRSRIRLMPVVLLIVFNLTVMVLAHGGKIPVLIGLAAGLYYIAHTRVSFEPNKAILAFAVVLGIGMQLIHLVRAPEYYGPSNEKWRSHRKSATSFWLNCCGGRRKPDTGLSNVLRRTRMNASRCLTKHSGWKS